MRGCERAKTFVVKVVVVVWGRRQRSTMFIYTLVARCHDNSDVKGFEIPERDPDTALPGDTVSPSHTAASQPVRRL